MQFLLKKDPLRIKLFFKTSLSMSFQTNQIWIDKKMNIKNKAKFKDLIVKSISMLIVPILKQLQQYDNDYH